MRYDKIFKEVLEESELDLDLIYSDTVLMKNALYDRILRESQLSHDELLEEWKLIVKQIEKLNFDTDPIHFKESLDTARKAKCGEHFVERSLNSLLKMKTYKVKGLNVGFALDLLNGKHIKIVAMHNCSKYGRLGTSLINAAIKLGGKYLECFGKTLRDNLYYIAGFREYKKLVQRDMGKGHLEDLYFMILEKYKKDFN